MPEPLDELRNLRAEVEALKTRVTALERGAAATPALQIQSSENAGLGIKTVNRVGALTLAIGIAFFFKYAADNQWIGPRARIAIGICIGIALLSASQWLDRRGERVFGQGIGGCGFAGIYISAYAAYIYYHLIGLGLAVLTLFLISALPVALAIFTNNPIMSLLGFAGALLSPVVLSFSRNQFEAVYACVALIAFVLSTAVSKRIARTGDYAYVVGHLCIVVACLDQISRRFNTDSSVKALVSVLLAGYGIALLSWSVRRASVLNRGLGLFFLGVVIAKLYLYDVWQLEYAARITAFVLLGVLLLLASYIYSRWKSRGNV